MKWLMFIVNLLPSTVFASATIQEQIAASNNTIMVATRTANVGIATNTPSSGVSLDVAGAAQFGQGVNKSTFNATVSGTVYALQTSSGVKVGGGGPVQFQDGTLQYTAAVVGGPTLSGNNAWTGNETHAGVETFNSSVAINGRLSNVSQYISKITFNGESGGTFSNLVSTKSYHIHASWMEGTVTNTYGYVQINGSSAASYRWATFRVQSGGLTSASGVQGDTLCRLTTDAVINGGDLFVADLYFEVAAGGGGETIVRWDSTTFTQAGVTYRDIGSCRAILTMTSIIVGTNAGTQYSGSLTLFQDNVP